MKKRQTDGLLYLDDSRFDIQRRPLFPRMPLYRLFYVSSVYVRTICHVYSHIFYFSHPRKLDDGYDRIPQLRDFLNAVSKDILFSFSFFFLE